LQGGPSDEKGADQQPELEPGEEGVRREPTDMAHRDGPAVPRGGTGGRRRRLRGECGDRRSARDQEAHGDRAGAVQLPLLHHGGAPADAVVVDDHGDQEVPGHVRGGAEAVPQGPRDGGGGEREGRPAAGGGRGQRAQGAPGRGHAAARGGGEGGQVQVGAVGWVLPGEGAEAEHGRPGEEVEGGVRGVGGDAGLRGGALRRVPARGAAQGRRRAHHLRLPPHDPPRHGEALPDRGWGCLRPPLALQRRGLAHLY
jgi:hypothetical protein